MIEIKMPRLSDTMEEGAISTWRKQPGDTVAPGEPLVEIETDKAVMEYEAYQAGTLAKILVGEGETASIGTPIALIDDGSGDGAGAIAGAGGASADEPASPAGAGPAAAPAPGAGQPPSGPEASPAQAAGPEPAGEQASGASGAPPAASGNGARRLASPLVRKIARENHLDLSGVTGTGPGGRIIRADIEPLLARPEAPAPAAVPAAPAPEAPAPAPVVPGPAGAGAAAEPGAAAAAAAGGAAEGDEVRGSRSVPLTSVRRVIARRLGASAREIPHFYVTAAADAQQLMDLRATLNSQLTAAGRPKVSVNDLLIRAVALALRAHPEVNASYGGDGSSAMLVHDRVNIGVAVAADSGLIVPVIRDADTKTVTQIGAEARRLIGLANERKLTPEQTSGGTFTISNLGMFGVEEFTAIINPPEAAILAVGATAREPVAAGDEITVRYRMRYTLSSDHRVIDGALAARFLASLTKLIESPWMIVA
jgi:pyruvate dehydrogenase E2 component (dihydrolipoamide acetyltransferase)